MQHRIRPKDLRSDFTNIHCVGLLNDLWRYRVNDSTWTWISGSNKRNPPRVSIGKGVASTDNEPGGRYSAAGWFDSATQEFWLFGGLGMAAFGSGA